MKDINMTVISGRLTADPLFRETKNGKCYCLFGLASNNFFKKGENWQKEPSFILVKCWNNLAMQTFESLKKGSQVIVYGTLKYSSFNNDSDSKRNINFILARKIDKIPKILVKEDQNEGANENYLNTIQSNKKKQKQIVVDENNLVNIDC